MIVYRLSLCTEGLTGRKVVIRILSKLMAQPVLMGWWHEKRMECINKASKGYNLHFSADSLTSSSDPMSHYYTNRETCMETLVIMYVLWVTTVVLLLPSTLIFAFPSTFSPPFSIFLPAASSSASPTRNQYKRRVGSERCWECVAPISHNFYANYIWRSETEQVWGERMSKCGKRWKFLWL